MSNDSDQNYQPPKMSGTFLVIVWVALIGMVIAVLSAFIGPWGPLLWFMLTDNGRM